MPRRAAAPLVAAAAAAIALAIAAGSARAVPAVACGQLTVSHKHYAIRSHVLNCGRARVWTRAYLSRHRAPQGYVCRRFDPRITRVVFVCENPATQTRSDGPQSFLATR